MPRFEPVAAKLLLCFAASNLDEVFDWPWHFVSGAERLGAGAIAPASPEEGQETGNADVKDRRVKKTGAGNERRRVRPKPLRTGWAKHRRSRFRPEKSFWRRDVRSTVATERLRIQSGISGKWSGRQQPRIGPKAKNVRRGFRRIGFQNDQTRRVAVDDSEAEEADVSLADVRHRRRRQQRFHFICPDFRHLHHLLRQAEGRLLRSRPDLAPGVLLPLREDDLQEQGHLSRVQEKDWKNY